MIIVRSQWMRCTLVLLAITAVPRTHSAQTNTPATPASGITAHSSDDANTSARQEAERRPLYPVDIGTPDPMAERLCNALHTLPQTRKAQCCGTPPSSSLAGECARTLTSAVRAGAVKLVAEEIERCIEATTRQLQGCDWVTPLTRAAPQACDSLVHGQVEGGARCRSSLECTDGLFCRGLGPTTPGVCAEPAAVGTACGQGQDMLAIYTRQSAHEGRHADCAGACRAGQCTAVVGLDGACNATQECTAGTHCASGRCTTGRFAKLGEACSGDACLEGAVCTGGVCVARKAAGERCTSPFECQAACVKQPGAASGTCGMQCDALLAGSSSAPVRR
jgi:hypothetical protein